MQQAVDIVNLPAHAGHDGGGRSGKRKISDRAVVDDTQSVGHWQLTILTVKARGDISSHGFVDGHDCFFLSGVAATGSWHIWQRTPPRLLVQDRQVSIARSVLCSACCARRQDVTCAGAPTQIWYGKHDELMQGGEFYQACLSVDFGRRLFCATRADRSLVEA